MNKDKMELEKAKEYLSFIIRDLEASCCNQNFISALKTIKKELENSIPKKKIEESKKVEERIIKFYTSDRRHYYETDRYNDIIKQFLQELLRDNRR